MSHFTRTYEHWRFSPGEPDAYGEPTAGSWGKLADVPGRAYAGAKSDQRSQVYGTVGKVLWTFATAADVQREDRIKFDGRTLEVKAVAVTSRGTRTEALCEELQ